MQKKNEILSVDKTSTFAGGLIEQDSLNFISRTKKSTTRIMHITIAKTPELLHISVSS